MKKLLIVAALATVAVAANAQPFFLRGEFNGYDTSLQMTDLGGGVFEATATGLVVGQKYRFKAANADFSIQTPGAFRDVAARANSAGQIRARFYSNPTPTDGWMPNGPRLGLFDLDYTYELMGSFNGYSSPIALTNVGPYLEGIVNLNAGTEYFMVFRQVGDWSVTIKTEFADNSPDISFTPTINGDHFARLDLANGRYSFEAVPEPATMTVLAGLAGLAALRRRNRKS